MKLASIYFHFLKKKKKKEEKKTTLKSNLNIKYNDTNFFHFYLKYIIEHEN